MILTSHWLEHVECNLNMWSVGFYLYSYPEPHKVLTLGVSLVRKFQKRPSLVNSNYAPISSHHELGLCCRSFKVLPPPVPGGRAWPYAHISILLFLFLPLHFWMLRANVLELSGQHKGNIRFLVLPASHPQTDLYKTTIILSCCYMYSPSDRVW